MKFVTFRGSNINGGYRIGSLVSDVEILDLTRLVSDRDLSSAEVL